MQEAIKRPWETPGYVHVEWSKEDRAKWEQEYTARIPPISDKEQAEREAWWIKNHGADGNRRPWYKE